MVHNHNYIFMKRILRKFYYYNTLNFQSLEMSHNCKLIYNIVVLACFSFFLEVALIKKIILKENLRKCPHMMPKSICQKKSSNSKMYYEFVSIFLNKCKFVI